MTMDDKEDGKTQNFQDLRAKFEQNHLDESKSSPSELGNLAKTKRLYGQNDTMSQSVISEWKSTAILKKCSSELIQTPSQSRPPIPRKPDFLIRPPTNGNSVQEVIDRLNNSNIPLAGSLMANNNKDANESQSNASTSELSEPGDESTNKANARSNSFMLYGSMPKQIIEEMRASGHFKKIPSVRSNLPEGVGHVRAQRTRRMFAQLPANGKSGIDSWCSSAPISICLKEGPNSAEGESPSSYECQNKPVSIIGSSSNSSDDTIFETYEYYGKDADENRRCAELHGVVYEICCRQRTFLKLLVNICQELVPFIKKIDEKSNHKALVEPSNGPHILEKLSKQLEQIVIIHSVLYEEFSKKFSHWSALTPDFAEIFVKNADFLKVCSEFLKAKKTLTDELLLTMEQNKYLAHAIRLFEDEILNAPENGQNNMLSSSMSISQGGGISLVMHLDAVHQNVVRYILLMERYRKLLPQGIAECEIADKAITKLKTVSQSINCSLMDPEYTSKLMEIHRKVQGAFDIFDSTRKLIHEGRLMKQTRKELQERHLVLFSDWILVCRYSYPWDYFDPTKTYKIPIKDIQTRAEEHVDHEREFSLINPNKTTIFEAKSKKERDFWVEIIEETREKWIDTERNLQAHRRKLSSIQPQVTIQELDDKTPTDPNIRFIAPKENSSVSQLQGPLWIPDSKATKCMMNECELKFTKIKRRHHCRNCGFIICSNCAGKAPVIFKNYACEKVCSECYDKILEDFVQLAYFPPNMIRLTDATLIERLDSTDPKHPANLNQDNIRTVKSELIEMLHKDPFSDTIRINYDGGARSMHPRDLFKEPTNRHFRRPQTLEPVTNLRNSRETTLLISGKVHLNQKRGPSQSRWARLDNDFSLNFYEGELDAAPIDSCFIYGYSVYINENPKGHQGTEFRLLHQNQIKTERKDLKVVFRVENQTAADGWRDAFISRLELPQLDKKDVSE